jgi:peptide/nickel transport system ATP-binding protein
MIPQEPALALSPVLRVGDQIAEVIRAHTPSSRQRSRVEAMSILKEVGLGDATRIYAAYPHQLSGGQRQRVVIGQAIACRPALIIADEPTTALDLVLRADILLLFERLKMQSHTAFLVISHDPLTLTNLADRVIVMYAGRFVEEGPRDKIFRNPLHPYTQGLLRCRSGISGMGKGIRKMPLPVIAGSPPDPGNLPLGCSFNPRCADKMDVCITRPPERVEAEEMHSARCFIYGG